MNLNFDFREFQKESMERLQKIYAEALIDQEITEDCKSTYEKMQKILKCKEMEKCHPYLFTLDRQCLNEEDIQKIDELYECGTKRGFILEDDEEEMEDSEIIDDEYYGDDDQLFGGPEDSLTGQEMTTQELPEINSSSNFSVLYSAMKNGDVKMGEFYSNAADEKSAKEDCITQLTEVGYSNIQIMAVEQNKTAVDTEVVDDTAVTNLYENLFEDDSEEFEKQETGDISDVDDGETEEVVQTDTADTAEDVSDEETAQDMEEVTDDSNGDSEASDEDEETSEDEPSKDTVEEEPEEDSENDSEPKKELSSAEKTALREEYQKLFKDVLKKSEIGKPVVEMTLQEKIDFLQKMSEKWSKNDPSEFLSDKDEEKLNKYLPEEEKA